MVGLYNAAGVYPDEVVAFLGGLSSGTSELLIAWYVACGSAAEAWVVMVFGMPARIVVFFGIDFGPIVDDLDVAEQDLIISVPEPAMRQDGIFFASEVNKLRPPNFGVAAVRVEQPSYFHVMGRLAQMKPTEAQQFKTMAT